MIVIPKLKIAYQNVPKVATTTLFGWLYVCLMEREFSSRKDADNGGYSSPRALFFGENEHVLNVDNEAGNVGNLDGYIKFAVTRDPVQRFLSMYSGRVLRQRALDGSSPRVASRLEQLGLEPNPEINMLVDYLDAYFEANPSVGYHSFPMVYFMGRDMSLYDRLIDISRLDDFILELRAHFESAGAVVAAKIAPRERKPNTDRKIRLDELNPYSFEKLLDYYAEDYATVPSVSLEKIKSSYQKARTDVRVHLSPLVAQFKKENEEMRLVRRNKPSGENVAGGDVVGKGEKSSGKAGSHEGGRSLSSEERQARREKRLARRRGDA